jgi:hypothetical protein
LFIEGLDRRVRSQNQYPRKCELGIGVEKDRRVQRQRSQNQYPRKVLRGELEACDQGAVQGKRIRAFLKETLPKPES